MRKVTGVLLISFFSLLGCGEQLKIQAKPQSAQPPGIQKIHDVIQAGISKSLKDSISLERRLLVQGKYKAAVLSFEKLAAENPGVSAPIVYAYFSRFLAGDTEGWEAGKRRLEEANAPLEIIYYLEGFRHSSLNEHSDAIDLYEASIDENGMIPEVYYELAVANQSVRNYSGSEEAATKGLKLDPKNKHLLLAMGDAKQFQQNEKEAIWWYKRAIEVSPGFTEPLTALCSSLVNHGDYQEAVPYCERAKKASPGDGPAYYNLGRAYKALGNYAGAQKNYGKYVEMFGKSDPMDPFVLEAKSEISVAKRIEDSRKGAQIPPRKSSVGFSDEENRLLDEIQGIYARAMGEEEARKTVTNFRMIWAQLPPPERMKLITSTLNQLRASGM